MEGGQTGWNVMKEESIFNKNQREKNKARTNTPLKYQILI